MYNGVRPRNVMPVHGTWRHLRANAKLAAGTGVPPENILLAENGVSVDLVNGVATIAGAVPVGVMFVDGLITGDVGDATLGKGSSSLRVSSRSPSSCSAAPAVRSHLAHLHLPGFSEDPKAQARRVEGAGGVGDAGGGRRHRPGTDRPGGPAHGR